MNFFNTSITFSSSFVSGTGNITELEWPVEGATQGSGTILDVSQNTIIMARGSLREPAGLVLANLPASGDEHTIKWIPITSWVPPADLQNCKVHYMSLLAKNSADSVSKYPLYLQIGETLTLLVNFNMYIML